MNSGVNISPPLLFFRGQKLKKVKAPKNVIRVISENLNSRTGFILF